MQKAQASLEFITTYGWALMMILLGLAAIAYLGFSNTDRLLPDSCQTGTEFACEEFQLVDNAGKGRAQLMLRNNLGHQAEVRLQAKSLTTEEEIPCDPPSPPPPVLMQNGETLEFTCDFTTTVYTPGAREELGLNIIYNKIASTRTHNVQGTISGAVQ